MRWWYSATDLTPLIEGMACQLQAQGADLTTLCGKVEKLMASQQDLDAALSQFEQAVQADIQEIQAAVQAILAKVANQVDLSAEVQRLQAAQAALQTEADAVKAAAGP